MYIPQFSARYHCNTRCTGKHDEMHLPGGTVGYPAPPRLIHPSVCLSVCPSVHACRLGIQWKIAQAQQIRFKIMNPCERELRCEREKK